MAKFARCENCGHEEPLKNLDTMPGGWVDATERIPGSAPNKEYIACSPGCMVILMKTRADEIAAKVAALTTTPATQDA